MKEIQLTQGYKAMVDDEDYERLSEVKWFTHKSGNTFYACGCFKEDGVRKSISMHRYLFAYISRGMVVDHIDGNGLNNQKENLRVCSRSENCRNRKRKDNKYIGVWRVRNGYTANLFIKDRTVCLGRYSTAEEAALVRVNKILEINDPYHTLNILSRNK